jgi:hypothetical protein
MVKMEFTFRVTRSRPSATQGAARVYLNDEEVAYFGDKIELVEKGRRYYGEMYDSTDGGAGWASVTPDSDYVCAALFHAHEERFSDKIRRILTDDDSL